MNESYRKLVFQQVSLDFFGKLFLNVPILTYLCKAMQLIFFGRGWLPKTINMIQSEI